MGSQNFHSWNALLKKNIKKKWKNIWLEKGTAMIMSLWILFRIVDIKILLLINPCPAEPGYTLSLQTV